MAVSWDADAVDVDCVLAGFATFFEPGNDFLCHVWVHLLGVGFSLLAKLYSSGTGLGCKDESS